MSTIPPTRAGRPASGSPRRLPGRNGYAGPMRQLPREEAAAIYRRLYWLRPRLRRGRRDAAPRIAAELFDTGVNMGPAVAVTFLQRALTALNRNGKDYPDLTPDGRVGPATLAALDAFLATSRTEAAARPCCCARSRRSRASATCASPSAGQPMRRSFTAGSRTGSVSAEPAIRHCEHSRRFALENIRR